MGALFDDHVAGGAGQFFDGHPARREDRLRAVRRARRPLDPEVAAALDEQAAGRAGSRALEVSLTALRSGAVAVVTGQQAGLFLGPLYTIYKAATAIRVARALQDETGVPAVPVFWLQSEDHDLAEIASVSVAGPPGHDPVRLALEVPEDHRVSVAHVRLSDDIVPCLDALQRALVPLPHAEQHVERLRRHYRPGAGWVEAFAGTLAELFAEDGLVLLDPRHPAMAPLASPVHRHALREWSAIEAALLRRSANLEAAGYEVTVRIRAGSPLSFFHPGGPEAPRYRLEARDGRFLLPSGEAMTQDALLRALDASPSSFSTSALLRPILQDTLLPTAAYVGGPGEVAYLAQVAPLHASFGLTPPLVVPRARFTVVDEATQRVLARLGLRPEDASLPEDALLARAGSSRPREDALEPVRQAIAQALDRAEPALAAAGQGMDRAVGRARAAVDEALQKLAAKHERALLHADEKRVEDVRRVKLALHPGGPQERVLCAASFFARRGERVFLEQVLGAVRPFDFAPGILA